MKRYKLIALVCLLLFSALPANAASIGSACGTVGTYSNGLICVNSGAKKVWQKFETTSGVQAAIALSLKSIKLPKSLTPTLNKVRTDKSAWLDQVCAVDFADISVPECVAGDPNAKKVMVVYGDSHASMWMTALDSIAKSSGYKIYLFAKLACPLVEAPIWSYQLNKSFEECTQWQQQVLPKIASLKPDLLVVTDQWKPAVVDGKKSDFDTPTLWQTEFPKALAKLKTYTKKLVVISNNPSMQQDSVTCASKPGANIALCSAGRSLAGNVQINSIERDASELIGATFIDSIDWACSQYLCPVVINSIFVYFDQWHFTATYVKWLTPVLRKSMGL